MPSGRYDDTLIAVHESVIRRCYFYVPPIRCDAETRLTLTLRKQRLRCVMPAAPGSRMSSRRRLVSGISLLPETVEPHDFTAAVVGIWRG